MYRYDNPNKRKDGTSYETLSLWPAVARLADYDRTDFRDYRWGHDLSKYWRHQGNAKPRYDLSAADPDDCNADRNLMLDGRDCQYRRH